MNNPNINKQFGIGNMIPGYVPIYERRPDLFPNGDPRNQQQQDSGGMGQMLGIGGLIGGKLVGAKLPGWLGIGGSKAGAEALAGAVKGPGGTFALEAGATVPSGYTAVGTSASGGTIVAPSSIAGKGIGATLTAAAPYAGAIAGTALLGKGLYDSFKDNKTKGGADWASRGQAALTTGGLSEVARLGSRAFGSGKDNRQMSRDDIRSQMQQSGIMDSAYGVGGVDLGKDGGFRFDDGRKVYEAYAGQEDGTGEIDERTGKMIGALQGAGYLLGGGDETKSGYATGMLVNSLKEGKGDENERMRSVYDKLGGYDKVHADIGARANAGELDMDTARAYQNALNELYPDKYKEQQKRKTSPGIGAGSSGGFNPWSYFGMEGPPSFDMSQFSGVPK